MFIAPNKTKIQQALDILEEEGFNEYKKNQLKEELFKLDLVAADPENIKWEVINARETAQQLDWYVDQLKEFLNA